MERSLALAASEVRVPIGNSARARLGIAPKRSHPFGAHARRVVHPMRFSACRDTKGSLKVIDAEAGQTCAGNQQLLTWNQQGPPGPQGPAGALGLVTVPGNTAYNSNSPKEMWIACPVGKTAISGSGNAVHYEGVGNVEDEMPGVAIVNFRMTGDGWFVVAQEIAPTSAPWTLWGNAVCVTAS
jgi:hypothetical protein